MVSTVQRRLTGRGRGWSPPDRELTQVTIPVTPIHLSLGHRYGPSGELWEGDDPDGEADRCGALERFAASLVTGDRLTLVLAGRFRTAAIWLEKGIGPASDETSSPDLAELFGRVWLRDLTQREHYGPWDSPLRAAIAQDNRDWTGTRMTAGNELALPRGSRSGDGPQLPPRACAP